MKSDTKSMKANLTALLSETFPPARAKSAVEAALNFDPLQEAENVTGVSYKNSDSTSWLGVALALRHNESKAKLLADSGDTHFSQSLNEWCAVVESMGFRLKLIEDIPTGEGNKYRIWWHCDGLLLHSDSYHGDTRVNSANVYFNYCGPRDAMHKCSSGWAGELDGESVFDGSRDCREGMRFAIERMRQRGRFLSPWMKVGFLWLLHYQDSKVPGYDYKAITAARLARLPAEVRACIVAEPIAGLHSEPLIPNKKNSAPESTAPEPALSMTEEPGNNESTE